MPEVSVATDAARRPAELLSIQYLRAIAAVAVLSFHVAERAGGSFGPGAAGVDVFFVISGFIMWVINPQGPARPLTFLMRRATRIVPLYWSVTLVVVGIAMAAPSLFPNMRPTSAHVVKSLLFYPHADPTGLVAPVIVPGWTLNYEAFFYVVFAVSLTAAARLRPWLLTLLLGGAVLAGRWLHPSNAALATYSDPLLLEFLAGVWLGKAWTDRRLPGPVAGLTALACGLVLLILATASGRDIEPVRLLFWGLPALLIVAGAVSVDRAGWVPEWPIPKFLGDASYSIYLVHGLAISVAARVMALFGLESAPMLFIAGISLGIVAGSACYLIVERPLLRLFHRLRTRRRVALPVTPFDQYPAELPNR